LGCNRSACAFPEKNRSTRCAILGYCNTDNMPKLILTTESQGRLSYDLTEALITIGRAADNIIVIDDPSISSRHAQLELSG
jgi:pSer/pThr/pTyr-binding forkhead associated (FHA) protein